MYNTTPIPVLNQKTKSKHTPIVLQKKYLALAISALVTGLGGMAAPAFAGPEGGVVTGGSGTIDQSGNTTVINQITDLMAIDWNSFDE